MDKVIENWDKILQTVKADYDVAMLPLYLAEAAKRL